MNDTSCPRCGSANVRLKPIATRACSGVGAVTGGLSAMSVGTAGAALGTALMPGAGTVIGGVTGFLTGLLGGALSGATVGQVIDRRIIQAYICNDCGHRFAA